MLISRGMGLAKNIAMFASKRVATNKVQVRNSGNRYMYRDIYDPPRHDIWMAEIATGVMWWWILWHMWHDFGHIVGEFEYPDPSSWTDAELGIPRDDENI